MSAPGVVQRVAVNTAHAPLESEVIGRGIGATLPTPEERTRMGASRHWVGVLIQGLSERVTSLVRRPSPPQPAMRTLLDEAVLGLEAIQDEFDASQRDLDGVNWDELSERLDRVNDTLRRVVEEVAARQAPPREPG